MGKTDVDLAPRDLRLTPWTSREKGVPSAERRFTERIELLGIILLAFAAIATAWAGLESAKWGGRAGKQLCLRRCQSDGVDPILHPGGQKAQVDIATFTIGSMRSNPTFGLAWPPDQIRR